MTSKGWVILHRKIFDCWLWKEKPFDKARAWVDLLLIANHKDEKVLVDNEILVVPRGSLMTSIVKLAERWGWSRGKVMRFLDVLESEQMLNTKRTPDGTLVNVVNYEVYQLDENDDRTANGTADGTPDRTANGTQTIKEIKEKEDNIYIYNNVEQKTEPKNTEIAKQIIDYLNSSINKSYKHTTKSTQRHINARLSDGYTLDDFKTVIDKKTNEWKGTNMEPYLRPETLFGTKFESYLNQTIVKGKSTKPGYMANNPFLQHEQSNVDYAALEKELLFK